MKMNIEVLILTGMLTARAVAYNPCPSDRHYKACCPKTPVFLMPCRPAPQYVENVTEFEEICQKKGRVPRCCASNIFGIALDCADLVEITQ
ncbi:hypothetical protein V8C40DRAFT_234697 [Trichoderma camerunense]